jgi:hypothetical protein
MRIRKPRKVVTSITASNAVLLALSTSPVSALGDMPKQVAARRADPAKLLQRRVDFERVVVKSVGRNLVFKISGKPGRHCAVVFKSGGANSTEWSLLKSTKTFIGPSGTATIEMDMKRNIDKTVQLYLFTADSAAFDTGLLATEPLEVSLRRDAVPNIRERGRSTQATIAASAMATTIKAVEEIKKP